MAKLLTALDAGGKAISLALPVAGGLIQLAAIVVTAVKEIRSNSDGTADYVMVFSADKVALAQADANFQSSIDQINIELEKLKGPPPPTPG